MVTDIVDSTALTAKLGDGRMAELWRRHDRVVRDLLTEFGGREIDRADGFLLLFEDAVPALSFSAALHRDLGVLGEAFGITLLARVGLHHGAVTLVENSSLDRERGAKPLDVEGLAKPVAARVSSLAQGGQTLLTVDVLQQVRDEGFAFRAYGHWRLKGLPEPMELFRLETDTEGAALPLGSDKALQVVREGDDWIPVERLPCVLPAERDAFVGRGADVSALRTRLEESRLVTLLGLGGTGKTRLALRFAHGHRADFRGGVFFCDLVETRDGLGIASVVARTLDFQLSPVDSISQVGQAIAARGCALFVLDNFEQVSRDAESTLGLWLTLAPSARFLVTSREVLGIRGEAALPLAPLVQTDGVELFLKRARAVSPEIVLGPDEALAIEALVKLLDALPLAIELAATRVSAWSPSRIVAEMSDRFRVLSAAGSRRDRQSTLRGTLDWSWDLLSTDERAALAQLSIFHGGFSIDDAEAVLALSDVWAQDALSSLLTKSLVRRSGRDRFDLLVSVSDYATERLKQSGGHLEAERRHGRWFARLGDDAHLEACHGREGRTLLDGLERDLANLNVAGRRAAERGDGEIAARVAVAAGKVCALRGPADVACALIDAALACPLSDGLRLRLRFASHLFVRRGRLTHFECDRDVEVARGLGEPPLVFRALVNAAHASRRTETTAVMIEHYQRADAYHQLHHLPEHGRAEVLVGLGMAIAASGDGTGAQAYLEAATESFRRAFDFTGVSRSLLCIGIGQMVHDRFSEAREAFEGAILAARTSGSSIDEALDLENLAVLEVRLGDFDAARALIETAIGIYERSGGSVKYAVCIHAECLAAHGQLEAARREIARGLALMIEADDRTGLVTALSTNVVLEARFGCQQAAALALQRLEEKMEVPELRTQTEPVLELARARLAMASRA